MSTFNSAVLSVLRGAAAPIASELVREALNPTPRPPMKQAGYVIGSNGRPIAAGVVCKCEDATTTICPAHGKKNAGAAAPVMSSTESTESTETPRDRKNRLARERRAAKKLEHAAE